MKLFGGESKIFLSLPCRYDTTRKSVELFLLFLSSSNSKHCQVIITTYGIVEANISDFLGVLDRIYWDYVIRDVGHQIKNPSTQQHKVCQKIARNVKTHRLLLTETPIQNNLKELWSLFDWSSTRLLGSLKR